MTVAISPKRLFGCWRLVEARAFDLDGRELLAPYGPTPMGRLVLTPTGRMMAVICDGRNEMPVGEKRGYASYCGNYTVDGDILRTHVDAALIAERIDGTQSRKLEFRGDRLVLKPPQRASGEQRELIWERDGGA
jgi:hypothetical protein